LFAHESALRGDHVSEVDGRRRIAVRGPAELSRLQACVEGDRARLDAVRRAVAGKAELSDAETAWIFQAALRQWPGIEHDAAWQQNFSAMIEKARPHGWIDDQRNAIKAHIEWV
jgi:hypothetical protein